MPSKSLSKDITSYDLLKGFALILVLVDHVGHHFFPENIDMRVLGRFCVPIWFFLIGYAQSREVPKSWLIGGGILAISSVVCGQYLFPLSILFTLAIARLWVDGVMVRSLRGLDAMAGMFFLLFFTSFPTMGIVEYGTAGLLFTMIGVFRRHKDDLNLKRWVVFLFTAASIFGFMLNQLVIMPSMVWGQFGFLLLGLLFVCGVLFVFSPKTYPRLTKYLGPLSFLIRFMGRWTLEIYVAHLLIFRGLAMYFYPDQYGFLDFQIAPAGFLAMFSP